MTGEQSKQLSGAKIKRKHNNSNIKGNPEYSKHDFS